MMASNTKTQTQTPPCGSVAEPLHCSNTVAAPPDNRGHEISQIPAGSRDAAAFKPRKQFVVRWRSAVVEEANVIQPWCNADVQT